jgi:hypothetical protein
LFLSLVSGLVLATVLTMFIGNAKADVESTALKNFTQSSTKAQSGDTAVQVEDARITAANNPYTFGKKLVKKIAKIEKITIRATITDGDTGPGDFDENNLTLALDGIDTGIKLNGFRSGETDTRTNTGTPINQNAIKNALKADRKLSATIIDHVNPAGNNEVDIPANFETTLTIQGKRKA